MPQLDLLVGDRQRRAERRQHWTSRESTEQGVKELDDNYVACRWRWRSSLSTAAASTRPPASCCSFTAARTCAPRAHGCNTLIATHHLDLEVRDFAELTPFYLQVVRLFGAIFLFITLIMGVIVLFAVVNTMTMNVMERTNEIGTIRAMGVRRNGIRAQFVTEGWMLGAIAATVGVVLAFGVAAAINHCRH